MFVRARRVLFSDIKIQKNIPLAGHTTFCIGGPARYFVIAKTEKDLIEAIKFAKMKKLSYFILGGGSNLLVSDKGFNGVVIKIQNSKIKNRSVAKAVERRRQNENSKFKIIQAEAGVNLGKLVRYSVEQGLTGLEWAVGIPGTIGGAVRSNVGAFGHSISEFVKEIKTLNNRIQNTKYKIQDTDFSYRQSIFKQSNDIIILATFQLKKGEQKESQKLLKDYLKQKKEKQPLKYFSAGCIFKNPRPDFSAGYLIDQCGLKGKKIGRAMISEKHANFIINLGGAKARDVIKLIQLVKKTVQKKFKITLEEEIEYLGVA